MSDEIQTSTETKGALNSKTIVSASALSFVNVIVILAANFETIRDTILAFIPIQYQPIAIAFFALVLALINFFLPKKIISERIAKGDIEGLYRKQ